MAASRRASTFPLERRTETEKRLRNRQDEDERGQFDEGLYIIREGESECDIQGPTGSKTSGS